MKRRRVSVWVAFVTAASVGLLSACSSSSAPSGGEKSSAGGDAVFEGETIAAADLVAAAEKEGQIVLYTGQGAADEQKVAETFMKRFPKVKVEVVSSVGGKIHERVLTEAQAGKLQGDVVIQTDLALLEELRTKNLLEGFNPPSKEKYPAGAKQDGFWYAANTASMLLNYNTNLVKKADAPKAWKDLADPKWNGKIGWNPVTIGGTTWGTVLFMRSTLGEDYLKSLAKQAPKMYSSTSNLDTAVAKGEVQVGITTDVTNYRLIREQGAPLELVYPTEGVIRILYPTAVLKSSPHPNAAKLYAQWYLSKEGQNTIVATRGGYSARADVKEAAGKAPLNQVKFNDLNAKDWIEKRDGWIKDWQKVFGVQ